ncbi:MAG: cytochrome c biogenesis protein CcdA [bacterium]|nr:cytochrome c biogenesis protein CcdA [bacterium]
MLDSLFSTLSEAMYASSGLALTAAFLWGVLSILLSPCHLTSIPLVVGFLAAQGTNSIKRTIALSSLFAVGIFITIAVIGLITAWMGRMMGDIGPYGKYIVSPVFVIVGLLLMEVIPMPDFGVQLKPLRSKSVFVSALAIGLLFGLALGPCTFAYMAPVLGVAFQFANTNFIFSVSLLLLFAIGHCIVIVIAGVLATRLQRYLDWTNQTSTVLWIKRVAGGLVILGGIYLFFK